MNKVYFTKSLLVLACSVLLFSCKKDIADESISHSSAEISAKQKAEKGTKRFYGSPVKLGNGVARSWFSVSSEGVPGELGIEMTKQALVNLPDGHEEASYLLPIPEEAKGTTSFDHIVIDWNVSGHPPFFYMFPHFDFHFYMMPVADRLAIPSYVSNPSGFDNNPPIGFLPPTYVAPPGGEEAQMGKHWVDVTAPELPWNGGAMFTKTFIYGSYNGKVNFLEPMVTMAYLQSGATSSTAFPQPASFEKQAYYPTKYNVYRDNGNGDQKYQVTLSDFILR